MSLDAPPAPTFPRDPHFADAAESETVLYTCGTFVPGQVHDPCQHSTVQVLCCTCAGCMFDLWSCGQESEADSWLWWEAHVIAEHFDPWARHPYALVLYALVVIFVLASDIAGTVAGMFFDLYLIAVSAVAFMLSRLLF